MREKTHPTDIDIALLVNEKDELKIEKIEEEIRKTLPGFKVDIMVLTIKDLYTPVWLSIITEGWSVVKEEFLPVLFAMQPSKLYKYSIRMLTPVQKVQFDRGLRRIIEGIGGKHLTRTIVLVPLQKSEQFEDFLKTWKIEFETQRYSLLAEHQKLEKVFA